jgi:hypothetical protein
MLLRRHNVIAELPVTIGIHSAIPEDLTFSNLAATIRSGTAKKCHVLINDFRAGTSIHALCLCPSLSLRSGQPCPSDILNGRSELALAGPAGGRTKVDRIRRPGYCTIDQSRIAMSPAHLDRRYKLVSALCSRCTHFFCSVATVFTSSSGSMACQELYYSR